MTWVCVAILFLSSLFLFCYLTFLTFHSFPSFSILFCPSSSYSLSAFFCESIYILKVTWHFLQISNLFFPLLRLQFLCTLFPNLLISWKETVCYVTTLFDTFISFRNYLFPKFMIVYLLLIWFAPSFVHYGNVVFLIIVVI